MKLRRILPIILSLAMIVALIPAMVIGAADPEIAVGTVFSPVALGNNKLSDDNFALAAFKDGAKVDLEATPDPYEWAAREGDKYKYYMLDGEEKYYVVRGPETPASDYKFMFTPNKNAGAVVIFTAPVSGTYSLEGLFNKEYALQDGQYTTCVTIAAYKNGTGSALASVTSASENPANGEVLTLNVASVALNAGDTLYVVCVPAAEGYSEWGPSSNTEVDKLNITLTAKGAAEPTPDPEPKPDYAVNTVFSPIALGNNKLSDTNFALAAFKDGAKVALFETPDFYEWAGREGDKYKYYMLDGEDKHYVVRGPETPASDYKFMFTPTKSVGAAVIFTAPVSGTYSLEGLFNKEYALQDGQYTTAVTIAAYKNGTGNALASVTSATENPANGEVLTLNVASVELKAGETLYVVCVPAAEGYSEWGPSSNTEVDKLDITLTAKAAAEPTPNPDTSDNLVYALIALVVASAGVVVTSKKRRNH